MMATNKLSHLVGDYQSDSDNDDSEPKKNATKGISTDWTQCTDASSGLPYYWNIVTKEVTWEIPIEYQQFLEQTANSYSVRKWILCYTDDSAPYYFDEITREISWEKPADFLESNSHPSNTINWSDNNSRQENPSCTVATTKLNLVPEYNSDDDDDDDDSDDKSSLKLSEKPLFPSSNNNYPTKNESIKSIEILNEHITCEKNQLEAQTSDSPKKIEVPKKKPSFASIITGGRSPQHETVDIKLYTGEEPDEISNTKEDNSSEQNELVPQKTLQRKRRIEFSASSTHIKRSNHNEDTNMEQPSKDITATIANMKSKYINFQKGDTEFVEKQAPSSESDDVDVKKEAQNDELKSEQELLEAKLKFLCQGRADVSPVQIIQIQLEALQTAHVAEALHSDYLLEWIKNISNDLIKLENDAAPNGYKCLWNRKKGAYCYENTTTGEIKWEYPEDEVKEENDTVTDDDAMDICTTPPPNEHEDLSAAYYQSSEYSTTAPPPPPNWKTSETEKPLDDELASFYSDIAKLDPVTTNDENSCDKSSPNPDQPASPENSESDDKKKKKKKKTTKKLEPWRSGNLETWINKWQKAQKELDG